MTVCLLQEEWFLIVPGRMISMISSNEGTGLMFLLRLFCFY
jgi:hypothetical protein